MERGVRFCRQYTRDCRTNLLCLQLGREGGLPGLLCIFLFSGVHAILSEFCTSISLSFHRNWLKFRGFLKREVWRNSTIFHEILCAEFWLSVILYSGTCLALCLRLLLGDIGFVYPVMSMMVIGPSLPILRQRRWSLMYDVYWLDLMVVNSQQDQNTWTRFRIRTALFFQTTINPIK
jgi:hypothetical protein